MKTSFTKAEILSKRGCYERDQVEALSFINKADITLIDVMESEISIRDKRWFLFHACELTLDEKKELAFLMAKSVIEIYSLKYPNDSRVSDCIQAIEDFRSGKIDRDTLLEKRRTAVDAAYAAAYDSAYAAAAAAAADLKLTSQKVQAILIDFIKSHSMVSVG